jgi:hypothetical protein
MNLGWRCELLGIFLLPLASFHDTVASSVQVWCGTSMRKIDDLIPQSFCIPSNDVEWAQVT